ncbi:hypothetical protein MMC13_003233 [Lambiella insularis]|nr:hypothetical protein [Lambiella insularis]
MATSEKKKYPLVAQVKQSAPLEFSGPADDSWLKSKTILVTGGASGFGEGFVRRWAGAGATIVIGDINVSRGTQLAEQVKEDTGNANIHFLHCDVTSWPSQVNLFKEAVRLSPHHGIDAVVANAGIADTKLEFENPRDLDTESPPPPNIDCLNVDLIGVLYTCHLSIFWLPRNPGSSPASPDVDPAKTLRDRHILLLGSVASLMPLPNQSLYGASKHAVVGLYRCLRSSVFVHGIRINILCPYFIDTAILNAGARMILAGEAGTRFAADPRIVGRALFIGPRLKVEEGEDGELLLTEREGIESKAIWEVYPTDFADSEVFQRRMVGILNRVTEIRGWIGWGKDVVGAVRYGLGEWWGRL